MNKWQIFGSLITVFFMALLPFLLLLYTMSFTLSTIAVSRVTPIIWMIDNSSIGSNKNSTTGYSFYTNLVSCLIILISTAIKDVKKYKMTPIHSLLSFFCSSVSKCLLE
jgi:hypothetical protein